MVKPQPQWLKARVGFAIQPHPDPWRQGIDVHATSASVNADSQDATVGGILDDQQVVGRTVPLFALGTDDNLGATTLPNVELHCLSNPPGQPVQASRAALRAGVRKPRTL